MREGRLGYNSSNGRYGILSSDLWIDTGLHCGECLQILMDGNGCCPELVSGGDTLPWGFGIYPDKDITGHSHTDRREV